MSMFEGYHRRDLRELWQIADQLCGNLCRCTGYRPIRDAAVEAFAEPRHDDGFTPALKPEPDALRYEVAAERFLHPTSLAELFALKREVPDAVLVAGATEIRTGIVAVETEIAEPDREGGSLRYRGVDIEDLVGR